MKGAKGYLMQIRKTIRGGQQIRTGWYIHCTVLICFFIFLIHLIIDPGIAPQVFADEIRAGDKITIVTPGVEARLCPIPACGPDQQITRIPEGTVLTVENTEEFAIGTFRVKWFEVVYGQNRGWISIYDTNMVKKERIKNETSNNRR
jgi:hypothetical protein